jgi:hypothetical protein
MRMRMRASSRRPGPSCILKVQMRSKILFLLALATASAFGIEIPRKSPEFVIMLPGEKQLLVSQYKGKVLCLVFILTT